MKDLGRDARKVGERKRDVDRETVRSSWLRIAGESLVAIVVYA